MTSPHGAFTDYNKLSPVKSFAPPTLPGPPLLHIYRCGNVLQSCIISYRTIMCSSFTVQRYITPLFRGHINVTSWPSLYTYIHPGDGRPGLKLKPVYCVRCRTSVLSFGRSKGWSDFVRLNTGTDFSFRTQARQQHRSYTEHRLCFSILKFGLFTYFYAQSCFLLHLWPLVAEVNMKGWVTTRDVQY